jgi:hypothetical protein
VTTTTRPDGKRRIRLPSAVRPRNLPWIEPLRPRAALLLDSLGQPFDWYSRSDLDVRFEFDATVFALLPDLEAESLVSEGCPPAVVALPGRLSSGPLAGGSG